MRNEPILLSQLHQTLALFLGVINTHGRDAREDVGFDREGIAERSE